MGGEITWECQGNGNFRFILKLYRECSGITFSSQELLTTNIPAIPSITMTLVSQTDMSPNCNASGPSIQCYPPPSNANTGAVEEWYYTSDAVYPNGITLSGIPPATGWIFSHSSCCRNPCTNITNATNYGWFLRAVMYPYNGQNENPCFDNSPTFAEKPSTVICTGYPFTYNHNAWDKDLDSLAFDWAAPLDQNSLPLTPYFAAGYSYTTPLPGTTFNPNNVPATINPYTGEISFTSFTQGAFVTVTKVTSYKCGIKVAEIFREMQVVLLACGNNTPPAVTAPFPNNLGNYVNYSDTVWAGTLVTFPMSATDFGLLPSGNPQTLHLFASGPQFGTNYTSTTAGCLNPPCATLNPAPQPAPVGLSGQYGVQTNFSWQTDCDHISTNIGCGSLSNVYNFIIKVQDDFCPAPAISVATITIVVKATPILLPPKLRCASVDPAGNVTLSWQAVHDTMNSFNSYHIYTATNPAGPFTKIDSIFNINQTSYTHTGAGANTQSIYYYIKTRSGCYGKYYSASSDTLRTIFLNAVNSGSGTAQITWNPLHNPNLPTSHGWYHLYREYPPGVWTMIDSTQALSYSDTITLCHAQINYYVDIEDSLPCTSVSSIDGDLFQDITAPVTPVMDSVSVNASGTYSMLGWTQSPSGDTQGYIVYESINGVWIPIDTVYGIGTTTYTNTHSTNSNPDSASLAYCIAAFDSCHNTSPLGINHKTIYLNSQLDICGGSVRLSWTPYINMHPGLMGYKVFVKENNGPLTLLTTNPPTNQSYTHTPLNQGSVYVYTIRAFDSTGTVTSTSNPDTVIAYAPSQPQFVYLRYVTVRNNISVDLKAIIDTSGYISTCKIVRAETFAGPFSLIGNVNPVPNSNTISYNDASVFVNQTSYYYKVILVDSCGNDVVTSNIGRTIYLQATPGSDMKNSLSWNNYQDWLGGVSLYRIYRKVDDVPDPNPLVTLPPTTLNYIDDVSALTETTGKFEYQVQAVEGPGDPYLVTDTSVSNDAIALQPPRFYVPNAFAPKGLNNIFIPVNVFVNSEDYLFSIYNRWGMIIFSTSDTKMGWNGTFDGLPSPQGVYVYSIKYKNSQGKTVQKSGTVTLLR